MKIKKPLNSILVAVQFKDFYKEIHDEINKDQLLKNKQFDFVITNLTNDYGIKSLRSKISPPAEILVSPMRIQFQELNIGDIEEANTLAIMDSLYDKRAQMVSEKYRDDVEFTGAIIQAQFNLEQEELDKLKEMSSDKYVFKKIERKINFSDEKNFNYNVSFLFENNALIAMFDVNDRNLENSSKDNLKDILSVIKSYLDNPDKMNELLWQS
jgi:hypothetical protein